MSNFARCTALDDLKKKRVAQYGGSDSGKWTISTDDPRIAGIGPASFEASLGSDAIQLQTLCAGLIEKAKRKGLDGRLIAMANTDFERGFMALEKAINTNKG